MKTKNYTKYELNDVTVYYYEPAAPVRWGNNWVVYYHEKKRHKIKVNRYGAENTIICACHDIKAKENQSYWDRYIEKQAARMGVTVEVVKAHLDKLHQDNIKYKVKQDKGEIDCESYELRKQLELAQYRPAGDIIKFKGYTFTAGNAAALLKAFDKEFTKPNKKQLSLFENEIATRNAAAVVDPAPAVEAVEAAPVVEDVEAAAAAHFQDLANNAPAVDYFHNDNLQDNEQLPAPPAVVNIDVPGTPAALVEAAKESGHLVICSLPKPAPEPEPTPAPVETPAAAPVEAAPVPTTSQKTEPTAPAPTVKKTAADEFIETGAYPIWYNSQLEGVNEYGVEFKVVSWGRKQVKVEYFDGQRRIVPVRNFIDSVENGHVIVFAPYDYEYAVYLKQKQTTPTDEKTDTITDSEVLESAARIKANYESMQAEIESQKQQAAAAFADAITAYCDSLTEPEPLPWEPETIIIPFEPKQPAPAPAPVNSRRWSWPRWLSRAAAVLLLVVVSGLLLAWGNNGTEAGTEAAAGDEIAMYVDLQPVSVTAERPQGSYEVKPPAPPDGEKMAVTPTNQNTDVAEDMNAAPDGTDDGPAVTPSPSPSPAAAPAASHGLTICADTPWAYTMMNWA